MNKKKWTVYIPEMTSPKEPQREILDPIAELIFGYSKDEAELISIASKVDAIAVNMSTKMTRTVIEACPNLKLIAKYGVGVENIDIKAATDVGIPVTNNPGVNADAVADVVIGLTLCVLRHLQIGKTFIKEGGAWRNPKFLGDDIGASVFGSIGYGNIAKCAIRKLQGFDVKNILVYTETKRHETPEFSNVEFVDLPYLLKESDIVSIHKSLTPQSRGLIGAAELKAMKKTAYLVNTSRGALVQEQALIQALQEGEIAGAALDVFEKEPTDINNPLIDMENVVLTPHIASNSKRARLVNVTQTAGNIAAALKGEKLDLKFVVNPEVFKGKD